MYINYRHENINVKGYYIKMQIKQGHINYVHKIMWCETSACV